MPAGELRPAATMGVSLLACAHVSESGMMQGGAAPRALAPVPKMLNRHDSGTPALWHGFAEE